LGVVDLGRKTGRSDHRRSVRGHGLDAETAAFAAVAGNILIDGYNRFHTMVRIPIDPACRGMSRDKGLF
jgi:hypothetical protein